MRLKTIITIIKSIHLTYTYFLLSSSMPWISSDRIYQAPKNSFCFVQMYSLKKGGKKKAPAPHFETDGSSRTNAHCHKWNGIGEYVCSSLTHSWLERDLWKRRRLVSPWVPKDWATSVFLGVQWIPDLSVSILSPGISSSWQRIDQ